MGIEWLVAVQELLGDDALAQTLDRYERKKNLAMVAQVKPRVEALRASTQSVARGTNR
jgi:hypothetical protein